MEAPEKIKDTGFNLMVSKDNLEVFLYPKEEIPDGITLDHIKELLEAKEIRYGIIDDGQITEYLQTEALQKKPLQIAEGKAPQDGQDPEIKYLFDIDPLKIGTLREDGTIDFKERRKIQQTKKDDTIAKKIPGREEVPGIDVYGKKIPAKKPRKIEFRCGKGAVKSEDGDKIFANIDGCPEVSADGKIYVFPQFHIPGDVGLETGHVEFDGLIDVEGTVQDGFRVKGGALNAKEILKAEVDIAGNIIVRGGIIGAHIKTGGSLRARYIHGSKIEAFGDVAVESEVFDAEIDSSGEFIIERGKVLSSEICAKKGIKAMQIGSDLSKPCTLIVGIDKRVKKKIGEIKDQVIQMKAEGGKIENEVLPEFIKRSEKINAGIGELAQVQDRAMVQQRTLKENMKNFQEANDHAQLAKAEKLNQYLDSQISQLEGTLEKLLNAQDQIVERITGLQDESKGCKKGIEELYNEIEALTEWSESEKGSPAIRVIGTIFSKTSLKGPYSTLISKEDYQRVLIKEHKDIIDSKINWRIDISPLK